MISHAIWLYVRFSLSFRAVEKLLAQRGIVVTYETVRQWCLTFGQSSASEWRRCHPRCGDKWRAVDKTATCHVEHYGQPEAWRTAVEPFVREMFLLLP